MSNPWTIKLKKTGLNDIRAANEKNALDDLEGRQSDLANISKENEEKLGNYESRQSEIQGDAILNGQNKEIGSFNGGKFRRRRRSSKRRSRSRSRSRSSRTIGGRKHKTKRRKHRKSRRR